MSLVLVVSAGAVAGCGQTAGDSGSAQQSDDSEKLDDKNADFLGSGKADSQMSASLRERILYVANTYSFEELDAFLHQYAARAIVDRRDNNGPYDTLRELDRTYYVGPYAFRQLLEEARSIPPGTVGGEGGEPEASATVDRSGSQPVVELAGVPADQLVEIFEDTFEQSTDSTGVDCSEGSPTTCQVPAMRAAKHDVSPRTLVTLTDTRGSNGTPAAELYTAVRLNGSFDARENVYEYGRFACRSTERRTPLANAGIRYFCSIAVDRASQNEGPTTFEVTIENISNGAGFPTPFAPGAWALHSSEDPFFQLGESARDNGLEQLAEDGGGGPLASSADERSGVIRTGTFAPNPPGPIGPGSSVTFTVEATPSDGALSLASMFVQSNDAFVAPDGSGIPLFEEDGTPMVKRDVTDALTLYDAGTETNQAPGLGADQAPRQPQKGAGVNEGVVAPFRSATRALPTPADLVDIDVQETAGGFEIAVENVSASEGVIATPVAPVFYAVHDQGWTFFEPESGASAALETLAEDGSPADLVQRHAGDSGIKTAAAATMSGSSKGPAAPGETFEFTVDADANHGRLSLAAMVVESNDAFIAPRGDGIRLRDGSGNPRSADAIERSIERRLAVWDAGTEANEVPGVGPHQPARQSGPDTGPADPNDQVRLYGDTTNDLAGRNAGGFVEVDVRHTGSRAVEFTVRNTSDSTAYPGALTPVAWALTDGETGLFETGTPASSGLESLAEDGKAGDFIQSLSKSGIGPRSVAATPDGASSAGPIQPGDSYTFEVTPNGSHDHVNLASMVVPSNDTFVALGETGVELLDDRGNRRAASEISDDIESALRAYDAGTEVDQAGAAGPDQAPRQSGPDTGPAEGDGTVRSASDNVWSYPDVEDVIRVTIQPK